MAVCDNCYHRKDCFEYVAGMRREECKYHNPMTNEEWFCQLSTEEKVAAMLVMYHRIKQEMRADVGGYNYFLKGGYFREWLKEKRQ